MTPTEKEILLATRIISENSKHQKEGKGAFEIDGNILSRLQPKISGKMIDMPMVKWAHKILQRALPVK
jgi:citrate lyase beta subunit